MAEIPPKRRKVEMPNRLYKESDRMTPMPYQSALNLRETEYAIKLIKDSFERRLAENLHLQRVSAPLFVVPESGLNDTLSGHERAVSFDVRETGKVAEIVHSLAKWKRFALKRYGFSRDEGLYTDMNAIRREETADALHSLYVDQWDWELVIDKCERNFDTLSTAVKRIYAALMKTQKTLLLAYPQLGEAFDLPDEIDFVTSQQLEDRYPDLTPSERENAYAREHHAFFLSQIGGALASGKPHDGRAPDYDDWSLNGDILLYHPWLDRAFEISSMGVRVDEEALVRQLAIADCEERVALPFHKALLAGDLPYTIGGGIGQSRLCMFMLKKIHIGEVQVSLWPDEMVEACARDGIALL